MTLSPPVRPDVTEELTAALRDRILVLDGGRISQTGTHAELLAQARELRHQKVWLSYLTITFVMVGTLAFGTLSHSRLRGLPDAVILGFLTASAPPNLAKAGGGRRARAGGGHGGCCARGWKSRGPFRGTCRRPEYR